MNFFDLGIVFQIDFDEFEEKRKDSGYKKQILGEQTRWKWQPR